MKLKHNSLKLIVIIDYVSYKMSKMIEIWYFMVYIVKIWLRSVFPFPICFISLLVINDLKAKICKRKKKCTL